MVATRSVVAWFNNKIVKAMNEIDQHNYHLPKSIIVLPDKDLLKQLNIMDLAANHIRENPYLDWEKWKTSRNQKGWHEKQGTGSIVFDNQSKTIWIKILQWPFIEHKVKSKGFVFAHCHTFNNVMQEIMTKFLHTLVGEIHLPDDRDLFDLTGNLSGNGKAHILAWTQQNSKAIGHQRKQQQPDMDQWDKCCSTPPWLAHSLWSKYLHNRSNFQQHNADYFNNLFLGKAFHWINTQ